MYTYFGYCILQSMGLLQCFQVFILYLLSIILLFFYGNSTPPYRYEDKCLANHLISSFKEESIHRKSFLLSYLSVPCSQWQKTKALEYGIATKEDEAKTKRDKPYTLCTTAEVECRRASVAMLWRRRGRRSEWELLLANVLSSEDRIPVLLSVTAHLQTWHNKSSGD